MEGPRGLRAAELDSLRALTGHVMREGLVDQFVQLFHPGNFDNLRVCLGRIAELFGSGRK